MIVIDANDIIGAVFIIIMLIVLLSRARKK